jgi:hypothetical protein
MPAKVLHQISLHPTTRVTPYVRSATRRNQSYKPRLRDYALGMLRAAEWSEGNIDSGAIPNRMIEAIEIQDNNLVFWQNRYGHANRDHRALLEAASNPKLSRDSEQLLFGRYR